MIRIKSLYPNLDMSFQTSDLTARQEAGNYNPHTDTITLCTSVKSGLPMAAKIVEIHEIMHSTGVSKRTMRWTRLTSKFKSKAIRVEECIAEIATMIVMRKLGMFNLYSAKIPVIGINEYYTKDLYIPWREVVSCVNYYKGDDVDFHVAEDFIKRYCTSVLGLNIKDTYEPANNKTVSQ